MGIGEDRAFIISLRDTLQSEYPFSNEMQYTAMASYFAFWNITDVLLLSGMDIAPDELSKQLSTVQDISGIGNRLFCARNAVEVMFELGLDSKWDSSKIARMRGELNHYGGYKESTLDKELGSLLSISSGGFPLRIASDCFLSSWVSSSNPDRQKEIAYLSANAYLLQSGFVPVIIGKDKLDSLYSTISSFELSGDPSSFREFFYHQEFIAIYNYLAYRMKNNGLPK